MIEEFFYLDEGQIKITAASVGISSRRWTSIKEQEIKDDNFQLLMLNNRFDILPIIAKDGTTKEFFKADKPNYYTSISRQTITYADTLSLDTSIRDVIKNFVTDSRTFYFLTFHNRITGLITLGNLNCRQVQVYIFALICELERDLSEFIEFNLSSDQLEMFMAEKSETNEKIKKIWEHYKELVQFDLENKLIEHLFLIDFFCIIEYYSIYAKLNYTKKEWEKVTSINELRHLVAHPTRSLLDRKNDITRLWKRINKIEDLTFRINQWRRTKQIETATG